MSSPLGHSMMGYIIYRGIRRWQGVPRWRHLVFYLLAANAPDLDFLPGFLVGQPNLYHHGVSHSIGLALLFALLVSFLLLFLEGTPIKRNFAIFFCLYSSHLILDWLTLDTALPYGLPFFWPLTYEYYISPFPLFPDVSRASSSGLSFIASLFSLHNLRTVAVEFLLFTPFVWIVSSIEKRPISRESKSCRRISPTK